MLSEALSAPSFGDRVWFWNSPEGREKALAPGPALLCLSDKRVARSGVRAERGRL